jgi:predicted MFS family arabinose efflux permease
VVVACVFAEGVFLLGPLAFLPTYLHQRFGLALSTAAGMVAMYALGGLLYALVARHVVRRLGERRMVLAGGIVMGVGFLSFYASPFAWFAAPTALAVGFGTYLLHNTLQTNATQMAPATRGTAMALFAFCFFNGQAIGVTLAGYAYDHGGPLPLLLAPALALPLLGACFSYALHRRARTPS